MKTAKAKQPERAPITLDPGDFTDSQWCETFYSNNVGKTMESEFRYDANPRQVTRARINYLIEGNRGKIDSIRSGALGAEAHKGQDKEWIADLEGAIAVLEGYLTERGRCEFCEKQDTPLVARLKGDPDQQVCAVCHADPRVPTEAL